MTARQQELATRLVEACSKLVAVLEQVDDAAWQRVGPAGEWSIGKDAEHVGDGNALHQWVVRAALGRDALGRQPRVERKRLQAQGSREETIALLRRRAEESATLVRELSEADLRRPARARTVQEFVERVMIGHFATHQRHIEAKLRRPRGA